MEEKLYYLDINNRNIFIHEYIPNGNNRYECYIFFNPIFDEIHSTQYFHNECARFISMAGYNVVRFDYYANGDSEGELMEFDFYQNIRDSIYLCNYFKAQYQLLQINLFGLRMGADMCLFLSEEFSFIKKIVLIEPIINGKKYLHEQRIRRKIFYNLNGIKNCNENIEISGVIYEDHQGYLISKKMREFLDKMNMITNNITGKDLFIFKLNNATSKKTIDEIRDKLSINNTVVLVKHASSDFWSTNQRTITYGLSKEILKTICL